MPALLLAIAAVALHLAFSGRYGYFRDELYFIACAQHLAAGYVDQPPAVAFAAWLTQASGYALWALRVVPALCAGGAVYAACAIVRYLGGGAFAQILTGLAVALGPVNLLAGSVLTTTSFEPLTWTLFAYAGVRLLRENRARWWLLAGTILGAALWAKYTMLLFAVSFVAALMLTRRSLLRSWDFAAGAAIATVLISPNVLWQAAHGFPMLAVIHGDVLARHPLQNGVQLEFQGLLSNGLAFIAENLVFANVWALPIWILGIYACARNERLRPFALTYAILVVLCVALQAKAYYIIGIYPLLIAAGAAHLESMLQSIAWRRAVVTGMLVLNLPILPFCVPVLPIDAFVAYTQALGLTGRGGAQPQIVQPLYADEFGWQDAVAQVAAVYHSLPLPLRARTAIFADSYAYAGALEFYGPRYGLPRPIGGHNTFWLWGPRDYDGQSVIAVGATDYRLLLESFGDVRMAATVRDARRSVIEGPLPIYLCGKPREPLSRMWPRFRNYGA